MSQLPSKSELIWQVVASIPSGSVATYGQVAKLAGLPNHARYVGTTLRNLPKSTKLPWHRVVNSQGKPAFPEGSEPYEFQKLRLKAEGVVFKHSKISLKQFGWRI